MNRRHTSHCNSWVNFVSAYVNREGMFLLRARRQRQAAQAALANGPAMPALPAPEMQPAAAAAADPPEAGLTILKAQSPKELYRKWWLEHRRQMGRSTAWNAGMWAEVTRDWDALPEAERQRYRAEAELTKSIAYRHPGILFITVVVLTTIGLRYVLIPPLSCIRVVVE